MMLKAIKKVMGIGLLELMLSLAIIAILLIMATRYYQTTRQSQQVNEAAQMVIAIYNAGNSYLQSNSSFPGKDMIADFASTNDVPQEFTKPTANPWGGKLTAQGTNTQLILKIDNVPTAACRNLLAKIKEKLNGFGEKCDPISPNLSVYSVTFDLSQ